MTTGDKDLCYAVCAHAHSHGYKFALAIVGLSGDYILLIQRPNGEQARCIPAASKTKAFIEGCKHYRQAVLDMSK